MIGLLVYGIAFAVLIGAWIWAEVHDARRVMNAIDLDSDH